MSLQPKPTRYQLKTPYSDGTTHVIFEPLDFIARLAALVPKPRVDLTRFHGVFAPKSRGRASVTPGRGEGRQTQSLRGGAGENADGATGIDELKAKRLKPVSGGSRLRPPATGNSIHLPPTSFGSLEQTGRSFSPRRGTPIGTLRY
jgi:hypothetical protein